MTGDAKVEVRAIFADECPADDAISRHLGGSVYGLDLTHGALEIFDEVGAVGSDREGAAGVKDDVDDVGIAGGAG